jgi:TM2 domain-containing membrane protein YozV
MAEQKSKSRPLAFVALFLAWLVPGAGHVYLGRTRRGVIIFLVIGATFWSGVAMGGVMTVDYHNERWWFAAQMLTGVNGLVGWRRQQKVYADLATDSRIGQAPNAEPDRTHWAIAVDKKLAEKNLALVAPTGTIARAYAGVAGLLNLMCIFDAVMLSLLGTTGEAKLKASKEPQEQEK